MCRRQTEIDKTCYYCGAVGMLIYLKTFPDLTLAYVVGHLSRFVANPTDLHVGCVKRALRYLVGTIDYAIGYKRVQEVSQRKIFLHRYCNSERSAGAADLKSTRCFVFLLATYSRRTRHIELP